MRQNNKCYKRHKWIVDYSLLWSVIAVIVFYPFIRNGISFVARGDCFNEYYPILVYLGKYYREFIPNLLQNHLKMYEYTLGFGDDIIGALSWFGLGDIFTIFAAFGDEQHISYVFTFITLLRIYLSGLTFLWFIKRRNVSNHVAMLGAVTYAFSYYMYGLGMIAFTFDTVPVYLPIFIDGADSILAGKENNKKICGRLVIASFLLSLCGFYYIYMITLAVAGYCLIGLLVKSWEIRRISWRTFMYSFRVAYNMLLGIGMSSILLLPVVKMYMQSQRKGDTGSKISAIIKLYGLQEFKQVVENLITPADSSYQLGASTTVLAIVVFIYVLRRWRNKRYVKYVILCLSSLYAYFFPFVGSAMNGFAYSVNRWMFIFYFFVAWMICKMYESILEDYEKLDIVISLIIWGIWCVSIYYIRGIYNVQIVRLIVYSVIWGGTLLAIIMWQRQKNPVSKKVLWILSMMNVVLTAMLFFGLGKFGGSERSIGFMTHEEVYSLIKSSKLHELAEVKDKDEYYRVDMNDTSLDAPLMENIPSTYIYYSLCNGSIFNIFQELRISPAIMQTFTLQGLDGRKLLENLMSVKYYALDTTEYEMAYNPDQLPVAFLYEGAVTEEAVADKSPLEKMNAMADHVVLDQSMLSKSVNTDGMFGLDGVDERETSSQTIVPIELEYDNNVDKKGTVYQVQNGDTISIKFEPISLNESGEELYLHIYNLTSDPSFKADINLAGKYIRVLATEKEWYYKGHYDYWVNVSNVADRGSIDLELQDAGIYNIDDIELVLNKIPSYREKMVTLHENVMKSIDMNDNEINGTIATEKGGWVFVGIPYSEGWSCSIDGNSANIVRANYSFMAVNVSQGKHEIKFTYITPGLREGAIFSILSLIVVLIISAYDKKTAKMSGQMS